MAYGLRFNSQIYVLISLNAFLLSTNVSAETVPEIFRKALFLVLHRGTNNLYEGNSEQVKLLGTVVQQKKI